MVLFWVFVNQVPYVGDRGETTWVNAILCIVFECIAICNYIFVQDISYGNMGFGGKEMNTHL